VPLRIGGNNTDTSGPATQATVEPFIELAQNVNVNYILGVNLGSNNVSLAEEQASTFAANLAPNLLTALEIGNEPDGYSMNGRRPTTYSYADFLDQYQQWALGISSAISNSSISIAGPTFGTTNWMFSNAQSDIQNLALQAGVITQHRYVGCYDPSNPLPSDFLLQESSAQSGLWALVPYAATAHAVHSTFRVDELNSICSGGQPGLSDTFSSAIWAVDTMLEYAAAGIDGVNWITNYDETPYNLFKFAITNHNSKNGYSLTMVHPLYYGLLLFSEAAGNSARIMPASTLTNSNLKVWATVDDTGAAHLVIINKEQATSGIVQVTMPGYSTGSVVRLQASDYLATSGVTIGGQTFDGSQDGTLQGSSVLEEVNSVNGVWNISVNPMSAVLVNLRP
jgi:hypothetical protein